GGRQRKTLARPRTGSKKRGPARDGVLPRGAAFANHGSAVEEFKLRRSSPCCASQVREDASPIVTPGIPPLRPGRGVDRLRGARLGREPTAAGRLPARSA